MLKNIWITPFAHDAVSMTLESDLDKGQITVRETIFPNKETEGGTRHTLVISYLTSEDINKLAQRLDTIRTDI